MENAEDAEEIKLKFNQKNIWNISYAMIVDFSYRESLDFACKICGKLGHLDSFCRKKIYKKHGND